MNRLHDGPPAPTVPTWAHLTARQQEVVIQRIFYRRRHKEIATELHICVGTVRHHMQMIFDKLQLENRSAVSLAIWVMNHRAEIGALSNAWTA